MDKSPNRFIQLERVHAVQFYLHRSITDKYDLE